MTATEDCLNLSVNVCSDTLYTKKSKIIPLSLPYRMIILSFRFELDLSWSPKYYVHSALEGIWVQSRDTEKRSTGYERSLHDRLK